MEAEAEVEAAAAAAEAAAAEAEAMVAEAEAEVTSKVTSAIASSRVCGLAPSFSTLSTASPGAMRSRAGRRVGGDGGGGGGGDGGGGDGGGGGGGASPHHGQPRSSPYARRRSPSPYARRRSSQLPGELPRGPRGGTPPGPGPGEGLGPRAQMRSKGLQTPSPKLAPVLRPVLASSAPRGHRNNPFGRLPPLDPDPNPSPSPDPSPDPRPNPDPDPDPKQVGCRHWTPCQT